MAVEREEEKGVKKVVRMRYFVYWLEKHAEGIKFGLKVLGAIIFYGLICYGLYYAFELWHVWGALAGAPVLMALCYYLLKPAYNFIIEVRLKPTTVIAIYKIGTDRLKRMRFEGDLNLRFRTKSGAQIIVCEEVDWDKDVIKLAWTHRLSSLEFLAYVSTFHFARDLAERYADRLAVLEKALTVAVKALKAELIYLTATDLTDMTPVPKVKGKVEELMPEAPAGPEEAPKAQGGVEGEQEGEVSIT